MPKRVKNAVLVYQGGIANVFRVASFNLADYGRDAVRLIQGDFATCVAFARGMQASGVTVKVAVCNEAGDIVSRKWSDDLDGAPFSDKFATVTDTLGLATWADIQAGRCPVRSEAR